MEELRNEDRTTGGWVFSFLNFSIPQFLNSSQRSIRAAGFP